jgi:hypothetical protein
LLFSSSSSSPSSPLLSLLILLVLLFLLPLPYLILLLLLFFKPTLHYVAHNCSSVTVARTLNIIQDNLCYTACWSVWLHIHLQPVISHCTITIVSSKSCCA